MRNFVDNENSQCWECLILSTELSNYCPEMVSDTSRQVKRRFKSPTHLYAPPLPRPCCEQPVSILTSWFADTEMTEMEDVGILVSIISASGKMVETLHWLSSFMRREAETTKSHLRSRKYFSLTKNNFHSKYPAANRCRRNCVMVWLLEHFNVIYWYQLDPQTVQREIGRWPSC